MSEESKDGKLKKIAVCCLKNIVNVIFCLLTGYYVLLAFVLQISPVENKIMLFGVVVLWLLWIFAKAIVTFILSLIVVLLLLYGWYYYNHYDEIACKNSGGAWDAKEQVCKEKVDLWKRLKDVWENRTFFKISPSEVKKENINK